jgi:hypothetical protein
MQQSSRAKFPITVGASRSKRYLCDNRSSRFMRKLKKAAHKKARRNIYGIPIDTRDIV